MFFFLTWKELMFTSALVIADGTGGLASSVIYLFTYDARAAETTRLNAEA